MSGRKGRRWVEGGGGSRRRRRRIEGDGEM